MKKGFTLIEIMLTMGLFIFLFGAILMVLMSSDRSWRIGQSKLTEQQEARKAMGSMVLLLRQSNPDWIVGADHYPVTITTNNRIDFYQPVFDGTGAISALKKITFKINPDNAQQLLKKEGTSPSMVIANNIDSVNFGGSCSGCTAFNCATVEVDCPTVHVQVVTRKDNIFTLESEVTLRNQNINLPDEIVIEEPAEGEF